jgi:hypothetical protein
VIVPAHTWSAYHEAVWFPQQLFLSTARDMGAIAEAIHKALSNIEELRGRDDKPIRKQRLSPADRET